MRTFKTSINSEVDNLISYYVQVSLRLLKKFGMFPISNSVRLIFVYETNLDIPVAGIVAL